MLKEKVEREREEEGSEKNPKALCDFQVSGRQMTNTETEAKMKMRRAGKCEGFVPYIYMFASLKSQPIVLIFASLYN